jgi:hypothetical protein
LAQRQLKGVQFKVFRIFVPNRLFGTHKRFSIRAATAEGRFRDGGPEEPPGFVSRRSLDGCRACGPGAARRHQAAQQAIPRLVVVHRLCLAWEELQVEMWCLLEAGARGIDREIAEARSAAASANERSDRLAYELAEAREDLKKMRELVAGNERQRQGLEHRMSKLGNNFSEIRGSLRVTYTGLHHLSPGVRHQVYHSGESR